MKKIIKEWKQFIKEDESFDYDKFLKEFIFYFSERVSFDSNFFKIVQDRYKPVERFAELPKRKRSKIISQINAGLTHTWLENIGIEGVKFVIDYKIEKYLSEAKPENVEYLKNNFEQFFEILDRSSGTRGDVKYNRSVALLGQMGDWWIADDGLPLFRKMFKDKIDTKKEV